MDNLSTKNRAASITQLKTNHFDLIVIGGGITGAGIFLDAQSRGLSCCLIEMQDFSEGSSSRSTKLIHGGLRYLKQWNFKLVKETGQERNIIAQIARHLTHPIKVILPAIKEGNYSKFQLRFALWIYEKLANVPKVLRHNSYSSEEFIKKVPGINKNGLLGGIEYVEFQTNDSRLTIEVIKKGIGEGGLALSRIKVVDFLYNKKKKITGIRAVDKFTNIEIEVRGTCVINSTGSWIDQLLNVKRNYYIAKLKPTKGVHLVVKKNRFPLSEAIYFDTPDKRMIFAIPQNENVYFGTTDTFYDGDISSPRITKADVDYLLTACNNMFPDIHLMASDITGAWAGIRPLIYEKDKKPSEISRKYEIYQQKSGLITITGGKLTGYRKMAEKIVDLVVNKKFKLKKLSNCKTDANKLYGSDFKDENQYQLYQLDFLERAKQFGWTLEESTFVFNLFGSQSDEILQNNEHTNIGLPDYLFKTLMFTLTNEMVITPADFFVRRTNLFHFHHDVVVEHYPKVAQIIYSYISLLSPEQQNQENLLFKEEINCIQTINKL